MGDPREVPPKEHHRNNQKCHIYIKKLTAIYFKDHSLKLKTDIETNETSIILTVYAQKLLENIEE